MNFLKQILKKTFPKSYESLRLRLNEPSRYKNLYRIIKEIKPRSIVEVGTWNGVRATRMIKTAQKYHHNIAYYGFDLFENLSYEKYVEEVSKMPPNEANVKDLLDKTGATINLYKGDTMTTLTKFVTEVDSVDFIYIDGGHSVETIKHDWDNVKKLMRSNTIVVFDDYWRNRIDAGCKVIVDEIDRDKYRVEILPEVNVFDNSEFGRLEISLAKVRHR